MGLVLDSSVLIAAERAGNAAREALDQIERRFPDEDVIISVISLAELMHGVVRADSPQRRISRRRFIDDLMVAVFTHPVTADIAMLAGMIDGENTARGTRVATADLLIGATALEIGFSVLTRNARHFRMVPGLKVVEY